MADLLAAGGIWTFIISALGLVAIIAGVTQLLRKEKRYANLIVGLTATTFLVSVLAYAIGMWQAALAVDLAAPLDKAATMGVAQGYASTAVAWGALLATISAVIGTVACHRQTNAVKS